jgi:hypothetical protein
VATTPATLLAAQHRAAQARLAETLSRLILARWRLRVRGPGRGTDQFLEEALGSIRTISTASVATARVYYGANRRLELPRAEPVVLEAPELVEDQVIAAVVAEAFQSLSDAMEAGETLEEALGTGAELAEGVAVRSAFRPGREMLYDANRQDSRAVGWIWETAGDDRVCYRCSMQQSRGAVFDRQSFDVRNNSDGTMKVWFHNLCRCHLRNVFTEDPALSDVAARLYQQWSVATAPFTAPSDGSLTGNESVNAWRRYWEALRRGENEVLALARAHRDQETIARMAQDSTEGVA